ncbi:hypothetical protein [Bradyrhizobium sp.]|uniref:hypothetical protein n=1 Tax=Bradyrhizobium sp. TaxID=376 RepID=UPI00403763E4
MTAIFKPEGPLFRATEHAGGPWSSDMLQDSATTALMTREVERLAKTSGFAVRRSLSTSGALRVCAPSAWRARCCATAEKQKRCRCA